MAVEVRRRENPSSMAFTSAPSSPRAAQEWAAGLFFTSAPASPSRSAAIFQDFNASSRSYTAPPPDDDHDDEIDDFAFDFNGGASPLPADELFDHGFIRPLTLPPKSPNRSTRPQSIDYSESSTQIATRGREKERDPTKVNRRAARSVPPVQRLSDFHAAPPKSKWRLRDLFRSASEGSDRDRERKYAAMMAKEERGSSFRSTEGGSRRGAASAHVRHYAANRAAEELRKKTSLPYRQSLFGFLSFNPAINVLTKSFHSLGRHE